jgi:hypothetical protein
MLRRHFLRAAGVCLGLPRLESLGAAAAPAEPTRFIGINNTLGFHLPFFVPKTAGADYEATPYLAHLAAHRADFSVISGLMHTGVDGGHSAEKSFLSAAPHPGSPAFHNTVSLDQLVAEHHANQTRLHSLNLRTTSDSGMSQSCNSRGQVMPAVEDPKAVFAQMCFAGSADDTQKIIASLAHDHSLLDHTLDDARRLQREANAADKARLDEYFTALRDVERGLQREQAWAARPKPQEPYDWPKYMPDGGDIVRRATLLMDMSALAFRVDATRAIALKIFGTGARPPVAGVQDSYHGLSHHGQDEAKIAQLALIEVAILQSFSRFLDQLRAAPAADGKRLLDHTTVLLGSSMGNASSHNNSNLPMLVAGGGLKHGRHHAFDPAKADNPPLANLYLSLLRHLGVNAEKFAGSTGVLDLNG